MYGGYRLASLFGKKIANGPFVLARVAAEAGRDKILKAVVAAFGYRFDVIQRGGEPGKLLLAVVALVDVPLIYFDAVPSHMVAVDMSGIDFRLRLRDHSLGAELPARLDLIGDQYALQRAVPVWFTLFRYRPSNLQST